MHTVTADLDLDRINELIEKLVRTSNYDISSYLKEIVTHEVIDGTNTYSHFYHVELDGNGRPRTKDFIEFIANKVIDYSIPRSEIDKARNSSDPHASTEAILALQRKAKNLFTHLKNTGEGGEILLYVLTEDILNIPQLMCKMPLKTNKEMHYHGVDGIHGHYDDILDMLALYWGESKLYANAKSGIKACFDSLKDFLLDAHSSTSTQQRDIELISTNLDLANQKLEDALISYFNKGNSNFNKVSYRGVCLVGFDNSNYPEKPNSMVSNQLTDLIRQEVDGLKDLLKAEIKSHVDLDTYHIQIFMIPFESVADFREEFLKALGIK